MYKVNNKVRYVIKLEVRLIIGPTLYKRFLSLVFTEFLFPVTFSRHYKLDLRPRSNHGFRTYRKFVAKQVKASYK